jgi:uncharacterized membrane protein YkoI
VRFWYRGVVVAAGVGILISLGVGVLRAQQAGQEEQVVGQPAITRAQAEQIALTAHPGATVTEVELENEEDFQNQLVYEVELSNGLEVAVDATSGTILGTEQDD